MSLKSDQLKILLGVCIVSFSANLSLKGSGPFLIAFMSMSSKVENTSVIECKLA